MRRRLVIIGFCAAALALALASSSLGARQTVQIGNLFLTDDGGISPSRLPRHEAAPVSALLEGELGTLDGSHPPAARAIELDVDKTIGLEARGLPVCRASQIIASSTATAKKACPDAIVGAGTAQVEVAFPEQAPFSAKGPLVLFNGGVRGATTLLLLHAYVSVPAPTAIVVTAKVTRIHDGPYGLHVEAQIPRIAGGAGSLTAFRLKIGRRFSYRGRRQSLLTASCPSGHWSTKGQVLFEDGTRLGLTHVFPCTPKG